MLVALLSTAAYGAVISPSGAPSGPSDLQSLLLGGGFMKLFLGFILVGLLLMRLVPTEQRALRATLRFLLLAVLLLLIAIALDTVSWVRGATMVRWVAVLFGGLAAVKMASIFLFGLVLRATHIPFPRILRELLAGLAYILVVLALMSRAGMNLTGFITTSAILTAAIGLAMQDTLGNIMAGIALQVENRIAVGDWVRIDQNVGRVKEIRWRHSSIETRNWDTVIVPNTMLIKSQVLLLGHRRGQPLQHRQWVYFNVDFRYSPTEVIHAVTEALTAEPIENVASDPKPNCILFDFKESYGQYAVRYWLTDLAVDDPTDSRMRVIVYFALKRAGIPLSIPASKFFEVREGEKHEQLSHERETNRRLAALSHVDLFASLTPEELRTLADRLHFAPFTAGEVITRQGAEAHWLYMIAKGSAQVVVSAEGLEKLVAILGVGDFFGEMSLMTGAPRTTSVTALEDTHCYRLDKAGFHDILHKRPEIAEHISKVLAEREPGLEAARSELAAEVRDKKLREAHLDLLTRIRRFFGLAQ